LGLALRLSLPGAPELVRRCVYLAFVLGRVRAFPSDGARPRSWPRPRRGSPLRVGV